MVNHNLSRLWLCGLLLLVSSFTSFAFPRKVKGNTSGANTILSPENQRKYDYFFLEALRFKAKEEYDTAFELFKHCLIIDPDAPSAHFEISRFYIFLRQLSLGQESLEKAVAGDPDNYWYSQALVSLYGQQERNEKAATLLESMAKRFPDKYETLIELIELYTRMEDYNKVILVLNRLEEKVGKNEQFSMEKFRIYLQMNDNKRAFKEIESLTEEYPMDMRYLVILGDVYLQNDKKEEAYETYQKVLSIEPDNYSALFALVNFYEQTGQTDRYKEQVDSLLLNPKTPEDMKAGIMQQFIVKAVQEKRDSTELIGLFDRMMEQQIDDVQIPMLYIQYLLSMDMKEKASPILETVLQLEPTNTAARMALLGDAIRREDYEQVVKICKPGIELDPQIAEFYFYLGIAYYQTEQWDNALEVFEKALINIGESGKKEIISDFYSMTGDIYYHKKRLANAYAAYDLALSYNPLNIGALNNYAYYLSVERRDLDKAEEMSYKTIKAEPNNSTYLDTYAWILFEKGNHAEARIYIDEAIKNGGEESDVILEHCGDIYYMSGDIDGALKYWTKAKEAGNQSKTLKKKIEKKKYIAE